MNLCSVLVFLFIYCHLKFYSDVGSQITMQRWANVGKDWQNRSRQANVEPTLVQRKNYHLVELSHSF